MRETKSSIRRRTILKSAAATTTGFAASTMSVTAKELTNSERDEFIKRTRSDKKVKELIEQYGFIGEQRWDDAEVTEVTKDDETTYFVRIPYVVDGTEKKPESAEIVWTNNEELPPTAVHTKEDKSGAIFVSAYFPSESGDENVLNVSIDQDQKQSSRGEFTPQQVTGPAGMCGFGKFPNLSCAYDWVEANEQVSRSCSIFTASIATGVKPVIVASGLWCAWDLEQEGISPEDCDLCTSDLSEAASGIPIDPSDIPTDPDDFPSRPSWSDLSPI